MDLLIKKWKGILMNTGFTRDRQKILEWLKANLNEERFLHTLGVEECARELAARYALDPEAAGLAGLLHDCAKCLKNEELAEIIKTKIKDIDPDELLNYKTFHAPVGELFARENFGVKDDKILSSIRCHTLGKPNMTTFEKIIFLADKIEGKTRNKEYREKILKILDENPGENGLNKALFVCFKETIKSLVDRELAICPSTIGVYNWLLGLVKDLY